MKNYTEERYNRKKNYSRILLGIQLLIRKPIINTVWMILVVGLLALTYGESKFMLIYDGKSLLKEVMDNMFRLLNVIVSITFIIAVLECFGELTARKDESDMMLVFGNRRDVINQPPLLIKKSINKKKGTVQREFYTSIPMERWKENKEAICDRLNEHIIGDFCYGGKKKNKGNQIYFETGKGRTVQERGTLYDDTF